MPNNRSMDVSEHAAFPVEFSLGGVAVMLHADGRVGGDADAFLDAAYQVTQGVIGTHVQERVILWLIINAIRAQK